MNQANKVDTFPTHCEQTPMPEKGNYLGHGSSSRVCGLPKTRWIDDICHTLDEIPVATSAVDKPTLSRLWRTLDSKMTEEKQDFLFPADFKATSP